MSKILTDRALLKQALEALETCDAAHPSDGGRQWYDEKLVEPAITHLCAALAQEEREDGPATCWKCGAEDGGTSCGAGCGLIEAEQQEPAREPSVDQLDQIIDGLARCHVRESSREFLRTWIRDWTTHKLTQQEEQDPWTLDDVYETIIHWDEGGGKRSRRELARRIVALWTHQPRREWQGLTEQRDELLAALKLAEAGLADIGDADREPGDDLAWCERRAAEPLPIIRAAIAKAEGK
jgi:hypothetical protein